MHDLFVFLLNKVQQQGYQYGDVCCINPQNGLKYPKAENFDTFGLQRARWSAFEAQTCHVWVWNNVTFLPQLYSNASN